MLSKWEITILITSKSEALFPLLPYIPPLFWLTGLGMTP